MSQLNQNSIALKELKTKAASLPAAVTVDDTLSVEGAAADAKEVGEALTMLGSLIEPHINETSNPHNVTIAQIGSGTFAGQVIAKSSTQAPATMLLRNSKLVTTETNPSNNGEIVWQYS